MTNLTQVIGVNFMPAFNSLLILAAVWWVRKATSPSASTVLILKDIQDTQKDMQSEHKKMQEVNSQLLTKVAEINVWKGSHEELGRVLNKTYDKRFDRLEGTR